MKKIMMFLVAVTVMFMMFGCDQKTAEAHNKENEEQVNDDYFIMYNPLEGEISSGEDYYSYEVLEPGNYTFPHSNFCLEVKNYVDIDMTGEMYLATDKTQKVLLELKNPVVIKDGEFYIIAGEKCGRKVEIYRFDESNIFDVTEVYGDLPDRVSKCGKNSLDKCTLGEYMENDKYCYGLFVHGKEMCTVKTTVNLDFNWDEGVAVGDDGNLYYLFFANNPYSIQIVKLDVPEKMILNTIFSHTDYTYNGFFTMKGESGKEYFIVPDSNAILVRNQLPNDSGEISPIEVSKKNFQLLELIPENFQKYQISYGSDMIAFELDCYYQLNDYTFEYRIFETGISRNYLAVIVEREELLPYCIEVNSYKAAKRMLANLEDFLGEYEEENSEFICSELVKYDWILESEEQFKEGNWGAQNFVENNALFWSSTTNNG